MADKERLQLNLRLDGRQDLLDTIKIMAKKEGLSLNAWVVAALAEKAGMKPARPAPTDDLESAITSVLDKVLGGKLANIKSELRAELGESAAARDRNQEESLRLELAQTKRQYMELLENSAATIGNLKKELEEARSQLATVQADRDELAQLKKEVKEAATEIHLEERSIETQKLRWQRELSDAKSELADAKATILKQGDKMRELERGYNFKPNPAESALRLEIGDLQDELDAYKKQQPATASELPEPADLLNQLKGRRKKSKAELADVEKILEILEGNDDE
ncbi:MULTISPECIES: hypothetical protein [unclassified Tychonema]|uniref:hypothetical protein n=1 Tax=unclassified Tychonema TaxID=2642144 RepID=UPI00187FBC8F|nr:MULTISPECIES: hypothetical protein [unclassified Tychonema]MBE9093285.1 hypothetical protein [Tychonema sp. LEGE 07203]MBE9123227.1 hypothetical protein [Tychonema sp. LEGE 07199]MBE9133691.1 hypothetical protein [Tychonema sp. LEGE 07196]